MVKSLQFSINLEGQKSGLKVLHELVVVALRREMPMIMVLVIILGLLGNLMQFKINTTDFDFIVNNISNLSLIEKLTESKRHGEYNAKGKHPTGKYIIDLSNDEVNCIIEQSSNSLMSFGTGQNGEINSIGMRIESIIYIFI